MPLWINILSGIMLLMFGFAYISKLVILKRVNKIDANTLGKSNKEKRIRIAELSVKTTSFTWLVLWVLEVLFSQYILKYIPMLYENSILLYIGLFVNFIGVLIFTIAAFSMKSSWRVGIDKNTKSSLVTEGIYKFSRNPAFVGFDLMFLGLFTTYPNILTLLILILNLVSFHLLILQEERHLSKMFGAEYTEYKKRTPRYILF